MYAKTEAIKKMRNGYKITHALFAEGEWITFYNEDTLLLADGTFANAFEFFLWRDGVKWDNGYSTYQSKTRLRKR